MQSNQYPEKELYKPNVLFLQERPIKLYDPTAFMSQSKSSRSSFATVRNPKSSLEALLDISLGLPDVVIADVGYKLNLPEMQGYNSIWRALAIVTGKNLNQNSEYTAADVLMLALQKKLIPILSGTDEDIERVRAASSELTNIEIAAEHIRCLPRGGNKKSSLTFRDRLEKILTDKAMPPRPRDNFLLKGHSLYVFLGATNSGKTRTTRAICADPSFPIFRELPKLTSRPRRESDRALDDTIAASNEPNIDTIFVPAEYIEGLGDRVITYTLYGQQYGVLKKAVWNGLGTNNLVFATASRELLMKLRQTRLLSGKVVPILLYPPQNFVKARVTLNPEKCDRVNEIPRQYDEFDRLIGMDSVKYVLRFNPDAVDCTGANASHLSLDEQVQRVVKQYLLHRVRGIISAEKIVPKELAAKGFTPAYSNQQFYSAWVDAFTKTLFNGLTFSDLEAQCGSVNLSFNEAEVSECGSGSMPHALYDELTKYRVVAVSRAYGIGSVFLAQPADTMTYTFGTMRGVLTSLLLKRMREFPYTIRDNTPAFSECSQFGYVRADQPVLSDLFQYRVTDHYQRAGRNPADWPLRGIAIGFAPLDTQIFPVEQTTYDELSVLNYNTLHTKSL